MSTERLEYEDDTVPAAIQHHWREVARQRASKILDDAEAREMEPGQNYWAIPNFTPINTTK